VLSHLTGLVKDNTGYDYPSLLAGSEGTLAVITAARLRLVPRLRDTVTALAGVGGLEELHALARQAVREVPGLVSAEFFARTGLDILVAHAGLAPPLPGPAPAYLLLEASGPDAFGNLADVIGDRQAAVAESAAGRARLWSYAERALFARIRSAFDPSATLNPNVLPRLSGHCSMDDSSTANYPSGAAAAPSTPGWQLRVPPPRPPAPVLGQRPVRPAAPDRRARRSLGCGAVLWQTAAS
jgi:FAD/FMN-containing dehydrogenase